MYYYHINYKIWYRNYGIKSITLIYTSTPTGSSQKVGVFGTTHYKMYPIKIVKCFEFYC